MRKLIICLVIVVALIASGVVIFAGNGDEDKAKSLTIGVVIPYEGGWFTAFHAGYALVAEGQGHKIVWAYHNYNPEDEATAIQNLLARGVDAINVTSVSPESAEYSCRLANEEDVPIQITESGGFAEEGGGQPFADIDFNWFNVYHTVADGLRKDVPGDLEVLWLQGFLGTPPVIQGIQGFKERIAELDGIKLATDVQDGQYATAPSLGITKALVQSGLEFNVAIGACQEITDGIIQALAEENVPRKDVVVVSVNGGPIDIENFNNGTLDYCLSLSPGLHGMINAANLLAYMNGEKYQVHSYSPIIWVSKDDWQEKLIPWDVDESWMPVVDEFVKTGKYKPELKL
jgi:simple sugar transport system substrate-binding protein